jgi:DNA invertase Pin-like site-specific DNA recombinase
MLLEEFSDLGVSGATELADRPGLAALLDRLESNGVRTVIVERADRLARDLMVQEVIVGQFSKLGARILTADGVDLTSSDDPTRRLIRQVLGAVAEFEKT